MRLKASLRGLLLAASAAASFAAGTAGAQNLTVGLQLEPTSVDPHFHTFAPNIALALQLFDPLVRQDERQQLRPSLAESWATIDDTTWEFRLRKGVKFHDGSDFTAEDVAASIRRAPAVPNSPGSFGFYTRGIRETLVVDPYTVRFKTAEPNPMLPRDLSMVAIISRKAEQATTADFASGAAAIGTGPYRFAEWRLGDRLAMRRNDAYWGPAPVWETVVLRPIKNDSARVATLLSGQVDVIEAVPPSDIPTLRVRADVVTTETASTRLIFMGLDTHNDRSPFVTDAAGRPLDRNPLKDLRVRRALSKAINREALAVRIMDGTAIPAGQLLPDDMYGSNPDLKPEAFDPEGAIRLLAEAGYPSGFGVTLHGPNDRFTNDERVVQAIGSMLTRVGIITKVEVMPFNLFSARNAKFEFSLYVRSWLSDTGEASSPLRGLLATIDEKRGMGLSNRGQYSNPAMDALLQRALVTFDVRARETLLRQATELAVADLGVIPLQFQIAVWGMKRGFAYAPRVDGLTLATDFSRR